MSAERDNSDLRDKALARLLSDALARDSAHDGAKDADCPEAAIIAAYAERTLSPGEAAQWERHFSSCARCQKILASVALTDDLAVQRPLAATVTISTSPPTRQATYWRWLVPALGAAAAIAIWLALRPAPPTQTLQAHLSTQNEVPAVQPSAAPNSPATPAPPPRPLAPKAPNESVLPLAENAPQTPQEFATDALKKSAPAPLPPPAAAAAPSQDLEAQAAPATAPPANEPGNQNAPAAKSAPQSAPASPGAGQGVLGGVAPRALALRAPQVSATFASPTREVLWRLMPGGRIQRSGDNGQTWQDQVSGVTTPLTAGAAPSNDAAWIVGRAGVILRTTDGGAHWQRVIPPTEAAGVTLDFVAVTASDASRATLTVPNGRRFVTLDGGQTWMAQ